MSIKVDMWGFNEWTLFKFANSVVAISWSAFGVIIGIGSSGGDIFHLGGAFSWCNMKQFSSSCPQALQALQN